jgi:hypothetical protein
MRLPPDELLYLLARVTDNAKARQIGTESTPGVAFMLYDH